MPWQKNGTPNTLTTAGATVSVNDLTNEKSNQFLAHTFPSTTTAQDWTFNSSTGSFYALRRSFSGQSDGTSVSQTSVDLRFNSNEDYLHVINTVWVSGQEKLSLGETVGNSGGGVGNVPSRIEFVFKYAPSPDEILSEAKLDKGAFVNFATNSNLSVLSDVPTVPETIGGWVELGRTTLGSPGDTITVSGLADKRYYMVLAHHIATGGNIGTSAILNGDTAGNYTNRREFNGGTDTTAINSGLLYGLGGNAAEDNQSFDVAYLANLPSKEKLALAFSAESPATGAGTAASRSQNIGKHVQTSVSINAVAHTNGEAGSYDTNSEVVVLGWDPTDIHTNNFWEELDSVSLSTTTDIFNSNTFTEKKYLWVQLFANYTGDTNTTVNFNSDTGTAYSQRQSFSGGADSTTVNQTKFSLQDSAVKNQMFENMFIINNASEEKLIIAHQISTSDGASLVPSRAEHVAKWTNTSDQITSIQFTQTGPGSYISGSEMRIWGSN